MTPYFIVKYLHMLGAIVILGTETGIAFFMLMAHRSGDPAFVAQTAATVVVADVLFTASAVVLQPVTGGFLMALSEASLHRMPDRIPPQLRGGIARRNRGIARLHDRGRGPDTGSVDRAARRAGQDRAGNRFDDRRLIDAG
jgi:hypothetical protein